jgi:hypothetical protein
MVYDGKSSPWLIFRNKKKISTQKRQLIIVQNYIYISFIQFPQNYNVIKIIC